VDESAAITGEIAAVEESIKAIEADLDAHGESPTLYRRLREKEARLAELGRRRDEARQAAACPLSEAWGTAQTLAEALDSAPDPVDARLRLRAALRRITERVTVLVVQCPARPSCRLAAVQMDFHGGGRRGYLILSQSAGNGRPAGWWARSLAAVAEAGDLDLRDRDQAAALAEVLAEADLERLTEA
jgi:hypothetical protein